KAVRQSVRDFRRAGELEMLVRQFSHPPRTLAGTPLILTPLAESSLVRDLFLHGSDASFKCGVREHHRDECRAERSKARVIWFREIALVGIKHRGSSVTRC